MRFVRYGTDGNDSSYVGRLEDGVIVGAYPADNLAPTPDFWSVIASLEGPELGLAHVQLLAPVTPTKILCIGLNYEDHALEGGNPIPERPLIFGKWPSSITGPHGQIELPVGEAQIDFEAEVAVVVGKRARNLGDRDEARSVIGGISVINDITARAAQVTDGQWARGKGYDTFAPIGPAVVHPSQLDIGDLVLGCTLNGVEMQRSSTSKMVFDVEELLIYLSRCCTLLPGDVIATGTPAGIGFTRQPPVELRSGDVLETWVEGVGTLSNRCVDAATFS